MALKHLKSSIVGLVMVPTLAFGAEDSLESLEQRINRNTDMCNEQVENGHIKTGISNFYPLNEDSFPGRYFLSDLSRQGSACKQLARNTKQFLRLNGWFPEKEVVLDNIDTCLGKNIPTEAYDFLQDYRSDYKHSLLATYYLGRPEERQLRESSYKSCRDVYEALGVEDLGSNFH